VKALWYSLRLQGLPDEQSCVTVNSLEVKYTRHSYNILHDRSARGEHSRLVGAVRTSRQVPSILDRCNSRFGFQRICSFAADAILPNVNGLSFSADRLSAVLVGRGAVRAKARNIHISFFLGTLVIPTSLS
jgi:hypothetical protein